MTSRLARAELNVNWTRLRVQWTRLPLTVQSEFRASNEAFASRVWGPALSEQNPSRVQEQVLVDGAGVTANAFQVTLKSGPGAGTLSGGMWTNGRDRQAAFEFGGNEREVTVRRMGNNRRQIINRQFRGYRAKGKVVYPAARKIGPVMIARWVKATVKAIGQGNPDVKVR